MIKLSSPTKYFPESELFADCCNGSLNDIWNKS